MDRIQIDLGVKRVQINDGPEYLEFNPQDVRFAERFYGLIQDFEEKQAEYQTRIDALDGQELDERGLPKNTGEQLALLHEACEFLGEKIDELFGSGSSQKLFQGALNMDAYTQFFEAITPFVQTARSEKMAKYIPPAKSKTGRRVMK